MTDPILTRLLSSLSSTLGERLHALPHAAITVLIDDVAFIDPMPARMAETRSRVLTLLTQLLVQQPAAAQLTPVLASQLPLLHAATHLLRSRQPQLQPAEARLTAAALLLDAEAPEGTPPVRQLARTGRTVTPDHHALVHVSLEDIEPAALTLDAGSLWSLLCPATLSCRSLADIGLTAA